MYFCGMVGGPWDARGYSTWDSALANGEIPSFLWICFLSGQGRCVVFEVVVEAGMGGC